METIGKTVGRPTCEGRRSVRQSASKRLVAYGKRLRPGFNRVLSEASLISNDPFIDPAMLPGLSVLVDQWHAIRAELDQLLADETDIPSLGAVSPDHRRIAPNDDWRSFFFVGHGYRVTDNCARCPETAAVIDRIPGVVVAFFSIFKPGTHVPEHRGVTKAMLNVHLGLIVPQGPGKCEMRVASERRNWAEGELMVLDETWPHEAWNLTKEPRVVLFLQVKRPMRWYGRLIGGLFLWAMRRTSYVMEARATLEARSRKSDRGNAATS